MQASQDQKNSTAQSKLLVIQREFNVPVDQLFSAFTTEEAIKAWWWPKDYYSDRVELDFREGGDYFINMKGSDDSGGMIGQFEEIVENEVIVMTDQFSDEDGNPISAQEAKMPGVWPELIYITFEFDATDEDSSSFTLSQQGIPNEMQKDCIQGWNESFDKLDEYLEEQIDEDDEEEEDDFA